MDRINGAGHVNHRFVAENSDTNTPPTEFTADWFNGVQEELIGILEALGIVPSVGDNTQVRKAIERMIEARRSTTLADVGIANAYAAVNPYPLTAQPAHGYIQRVAIATDNTGPSTYAPDGIDVRPIFGRGLLALQGGELLAKGVATFVFIISPTLNGGNGAWVLVSSSSGAQQVSPAVKSTHAVQFAQLLAAVGSAGAVTGRNKLINGSAQISSRVAPSLTTAAQYGQVDLYAGWASGGAVTAGTLSQDTAAPVGRTGLAIKMAGVTLTGAGQLSLRYRMEAADAVKLKNQIATLQLRVQHDVGAAVPYTVVLRKPNASDVFSSSAVIATSGSVAVPSGQGILLKPWTDGIALGDCSNGLEVEVQIACGAVALKNFWFAELQLEEGTIPTSFEFKSRASELSDVQRYVLVVNANALLLSSQVPAATSQAGTMQCDFPCEMRATPSIPAIAWSLVQAQTPVLASAGNRMLRYSVLSTTNGSVNAYNNTTFVISAEL